MAAAPRLLQRHKIDRMEFARLNMNRDWRTIIWSDEKKWNLDGPDGQHSYWRDLRKSPQYFTKRNFGGGSVMTWAAFSYSGQLELQFTSSKINSVEYCEILTRSLILFIRRHRHISYVFQQDNASIHTSNTTMAWLQSKNVNVLNSWPACSPDLNPIENLWGIMVRIVYAENHHYQTVAELKKAILDAWTKIDTGTIQNLVNSMPNRLFQVINRSGGITDY
ncbi:uncharacterized protein DEA37_0002684 [Paragonimus westermani]|uniref:Tc1-like transposase DDE domain-containing protein n=1 Tax=Paragonimus westermani TaxID=34504 RepID=A0A5J4N2V7_9TREM|nr:uncharacterized protein DEA37_0002684 [Paragonimus westermani]